MIHRAESESGQQRVREMKKSEKTRGDGDDNDTGRDGWKAKRQDGDSDYG